ncbi:MAG: GNAT family N-acetyltransferase [Thermomicrobiales bacterium]
MSRPPKTPVNLPPGYFARPATMDDVPAVTELLNAAEIAEWGEPDFTESELRDDWALYDGDPGKAITLVVAPGGELVGYMAITDNGSGAIEADGYAHPGYLGKGIGTWLIQESERMAFDIVSGLPSTQRATIRSFTAGSNDRALALLDHEGYDAIRHFWRMEIEFDGPPPAPAWFEGARRRCPALASMSGPVRSHRSGLQRTFRTCASADVRAMGTGTEAARFRSESLDRGLVRRRNDRLRYRPDDRRRHRLDFAARRAQGLARQRTGSRRAASPVPAVSGERGCRRSRSSRCCQRHRRDQAVRVGRHEDGPHSCSLRRRFRKAIFSGYRPGLSRTRSDRLAGRPASNT